MTSLCTTYLVRTLSSIKSSRRFCVDACSIIDSGVVRTIRRIVLVALGNVLGPNNPDCLVGLCSAVATENTDDITHILFRKELDERHEIPAHVSDPAFPESRLSRPAFRLQALPFSDSDSIATLMSFEGYRIFDSMPMIFWFVPIAS